MVTAMPISKTTLKILAMPIEMTNRQVADALGLEIDTVKKARRNHNSAHKPAARDKGHKAKILAIGKTDTAENVAAKVGCSLYYVYSVWRLIK